MDPLSIVAGATAIGTFVFQVSFTLSKFVTEAVEVDETIKGMYLEVLSLAKTIRSIENLLNNVTVVQLKPNELWTNVHDCLQACQRSVSKLNDVIVKAGPPEKDSNFFKKAKQQLKINLKQPGVSDLRAQIHTHSAALQLAFSMINVHLASSAPSIVLDELTPKLDALLKQNERLTAALATQQGSDDSNERATKNLQSSATQIASNATVIVDSGSTVWGGSQAGERDRSPPEYATTGGPRDQRRNSLTTGSELGEPLSDHKMNSISNWIEGPSLEPVQENEWPPQRRPDSPTTDEYRRHDANGNVAPLFPQDHDEGYDSNDEMEMLVIEGHLKISKRKATGAANLEDSEQSLRRALDGIKKLQIGNQSKFDRHKITQDLIAVCVKQKKYDDALKLCDELRRDTFASGGDYAVALDASYLLAQTCFLQQQYRAAEVECRQIMKAKSRVQDGGEKMERLYHNTIALLMAVHEAQNNHVDAKALSTLLPPGYVRPDFHSEDSLSSPRGGPVDLVLPSRTTTQGSGITITQAAQTFQKFPKKPNARTSGIKPLDPSEVEQTNKFLHDNAPNKLGPDVSDLDQALAWSVENGHEQVVTMLLDGQFHYVSRQPWSSKLKPANLRPSEQGIQRALETAVETGQPRLVKHLIGEGAEWIFPMAGKENKRKNSSKGSRADPSDFGVEKCLIHFAAGRSNGAGPVKALIEEGADPSVRTSNNSTPMMIAAFFGVASVIDVLLDKHADVSIENEAGFTALGLAAMQGHVDVVDILLGAHATYIQGCGFAHSDGTSGLRRIGPLQAAVKIGSEVLVQKLIAAGASVDPVVSKDKANEDDIPVMCAARNGSQSILKQLLDRQADVKVCDINGRTAVHSAAAANQQSTLRLLMEKSSAVDPRDVNGATPLYASAAASATETATILLKHGANVNLAANDGRTPFLIAGKAGSIMLLRTFQEHGANVEVVDENGATALMLAAGADKTAAVEYLISAASVLNNKTDKRGRNVYLYARSLEMRKLLRRRGLARITIPRSERLSKHQRRVAAALAAGGAGGTIGAGSSDPPADYEDDDFDDDEEDRSASR